MTVDDHALMRRGIAAIIKTQPDMELVAEASDGEEAITQFRLHRPDVTLMDVQMPNMNGTEAISRIRSEFPDAKILVFSTYAGDVQVLHAMKAGARGYLLERKRAPRAVGRHPHGLCRAQANTARDC
jgi:DNA-binding NarL/FixJ family response regulator